MFFRERILFRVEQVTSVTLIPTEAVHCPEFVHVKFAVAVPFPSANIVPDGD